MTLKAESDEIRGSGLPQLKLSKVQPDELKTHFVALNSIKLAMKLAPATRFSRTFPWNDE